MSARGGARSWGVAQAGGGIRGATSAGIVRAVGWALQGAGWIAGGAALLLGVLYLLPSEDPHGGVFVLIGAMVLAGVAGMLLAVGAWLRRWARGGAEGARRSRGLP